MTFLLKGQLCHSLKKNGFSIFMLNIASVKNKGFDLKNDIFAQASDHICVVETWLKPHNDNNFDFPGRTFDHVSVGKGKGAGIFSLTSRYIPMRNQKVAKDKYQILSIVDETNPRLPYQMVLVYASSGCPLQKLAEDLKIELIADLTTIIVGDFNFDKSETNALTAFLNKRQFIQVVEWPTHKEGRTIDHCYVSKNTKVQVTRHSPYYSDHDGLCIQFEHFPWC